MYLLVSYPSTVAYFHNKQMVKMANTDIFHFLSATIFRYTVGTWHIFLDLDFAVVWIKLVLNTGFVIDFCLLLSTLQSSKYNYIPHG